MGSFPLSPVFWFKVKEAIDFLFVFLFERRESKALAGDALEGNEVSWKIVALPSVSFTSNGLVSHEMDNPTRIASSSKSKIQFNSIPAV